MKGPTNNTAHVRPHSKDEGRGDREQAPGVPLFRGVEGRGLGVFRAHSLLVNFKHKSGNLTKNHVVIWSVIKICKGASVARGGLARHLVVGGQHIYSR